VCGAADSAERSDDHEEEPEGLGVTADVVWAEISGHPFFVGSGEASDLIARRGLAMQLDLVDANRLASGIVILTYTLAAFVPGETG
jgi:hypothetical protein